METLFLAKQWPLPSPHAVSLVRSGFTKSFVLQVAAAPPVVLGVAAPPFVVTGPASSPSTTGASDDEMYVSLPMVQAAVGSAAAAAIATIQIMCPWLAISLDLRTASLRRACQP